MSTATTVPALFTPIRVGDMPLAHRVVHAPMTRLRNDSAHRPTALSVEYYRQRARVPGTLLIAEGTLIDPRAGWLPHGPGIYTDAQIEAWRKVTDAVHANGSFVYLQLWAMGRATRNRAVQAMGVDPPMEPVGPSPVPLKAYPDNVPRELTTDEIKEYVRWYAAAAANAVHRAGFDGVEVQGANGYLVDQFLQDVSNRRADEYGGSVEDRVRFAIEVLKAVAEGVGQSKTAIRLSPWSTLQDMRMEDPVPTFSHLVNELKTQLPELAYIHVIAPNAVNNIGPKDHSTEDFIYKLWTPRPLITTGGHTPSSRMRIAEETGQLIGYGTAFLSNYPQPDLPFRLRRNIKLNEPDTKSFYTPERAEGYTTYPFSAEFNVTE